jgi:hypothetical protein
MVPGRDETGVLIGKTLKLVNSSYSSELIPSGISDKGASGRIFLSSPGGSLIRRDFNPDNLASSFFTSLKLADLNIENLNVARGAASSGLACYLGRQSDHPAVPRLVASLLSLAPTPQH